jgi:hypothetical protein
MAQTTRSNVAALTPWQNRRCEMCGGNYLVMVHIEPKAYGSPVTYYSCDRCAQILILEE